MAFFSKLILVLMLCLFAVMHSIQGQPMVVNVAVPCQDDAALTISPVITFSPAVITRGTTVTVTYSVTKNAGENIVDTDINVSAYITPLVGGPLNIPPSGIVPICNGVIANCPTAVPSFPVTLTFTIPTDARAVGLYVFTTEYILPDSGTLLGCAEVAFAVV